jgi:hypothetical protein
MPQPDPPDPTSVPTPAPPRSFPPFPLLPPDGLTDGCVTRTRTGGARPSSSRPVDAAAEQDHLEPDRAASDSGQPSSYAVVAAGTGDLLGDIAWRLDRPLLGIADVG